MRIVYFGTAPFAVPTLVALAPHIVLVVSQPDRPSGRGLKFQASPVKAKALELGIPVETPVKCRDQGFVEQIKAIDADMLLVAAYGQILPVSLLEASKQGAINLHGSILPKYRGAAPIQRAIENGDSETGVTIMQMDRGMDTGDMIADVVTPIDPDETYGELAARLAELAAPLAMVWAPKIASGDYPRTKQDESQATHAAKVEKSEAELRFDQGAESAYRKFRAFTPSPGAFIRTSQGVLKLGRLYAKPELIGSTGEVMCVSPDLVIAFEGGAIEFREVQPEGKPKMSGKDWANGQRLQVGMNLRPQ